MKHLMLSHVIIYLIETNTKTNTLACSVSTLKPIVTNTHVRPFCIITIGVLFFCTRTFILALIYVT